MDSEYDIIGYINDWYLNKIKRGKIMIENMELCNNGLTYKVNDKVKLNNGTDMIIIQKIESIDGYEIPTSPIYVGLPLQMDRYIYPRMWDKNGEELFLYLRGESPNIIDFFKNKKSDFSIDKEWRASLEDLASEAGLEFNYGKNNGLTYKANDKVKLNNGTDMIIIQKIESIDGHAMPSSPIYVGLAFQMNRYIYPRMWDKNGEELFLYLRGESPNNIDFVKNKESDLSIDKESKPTHITKIIGGVEFETENFDLVEGEDYLYINLGRYDDEIEHLIYDQDDPIHKKLAERGMIYPNTNHGRKEAEKHLFLLVETLKNDEYDRIFGTKGNK